MKRLFLAALLAVFAVGSAMAQETCESKAIGKDGKPLAGGVRCSGPVAKQWRATAIVGARRAA